MLDVQLQNYLARFLSRQIGLREFQLLLLTKAWEVDNGDNVAARELAAEIRRHLAELGRYGMTEEEFRHNLSPLLEGHTTTITFETGASAIVMQVATGARPVA